MNIFLIHGSYGNPEENWFPWLKKELEMKGHNVFVPKFPTPYGQFLENWITILDDYRQYIDSNTIFVGHSLGSAFILKALELMKSPVRACFFVAGFVSSLNNQKFDRINKTFVEGQYLWNITKHLSERFFVYASNNDPYVPYRKTRELAKKVRTNVVMVKKAGHFNSAAGYNKFDLLLKDILKVTVNA